MNTALFLYSNLKVLYVKIVAPLIERCHKWREQNRLKLEIAKKYAESEDPFTKKSSSYSSPNRPSFELKNPLPLFEKSTNLKHDTSLPLYLQSNSLLNPHSNFSKNQDQDHYEFSKYAERGKEFEKREKPSQLATSNL